LFGILVSFEATFTGIVTSAQNT